MAGMAEDAADKLTDTGPAPAAEGGFSVDKALEILKMPVTQAILLLTGAVVFAFWPLFQLIWLQWTNPDTLYQHGPLIPFAIAYIVWANWDRLQHIPIKGSWFAIAPMLAIMYLTIIGSNSGVFGSVMTMLMLAMTGCVIWLVMGFRWVLVSIPLMIFATLGLPVWTSFVDNNTNGAQILSTEGAYHILNVAGFDPFRRAPTIIDLNNFTLNVAAACSGMKLTLAMASSVMFIIMIARLKWWGNLTLIALAIPLSIAINALRIALIGVVGNQGGHDAGMWMHDYGSYGTLVLAFYLLYIAAKGLGWKV